MMLLARRSLVIASLGSLLLFATTMVRGQADAAKSFDPYVFATDPHQIETAKMLVKFFEDATRPPGFRAMTGDALAKRKATVRQEILEAIGLSPMPKRVPLDVHESATFDHPWCSLTKIHYQIWPGIYSEAFLYRPKGEPNKLKPAILSLTGHWANGKAEAGEQKRCLNFARLGYVVLATDQDHYEDLPIGISHQTHMVWSNIRALDLLESLPDVGKQRIGACGGSGGGYQTQMLLALDDRLKAATIMGFTCDFREIIFPHVASCDCVHYPGSLTLANQPEVSAMAMPVPDQFLTMDDYTKNFRQTAFPQIEDLYRQNGYPDRVACMYWSTEHAYDKPKREATYQWMQRWLCGDATIVQEPDTVTLPVPRLVALDTHLPGDAKKLEALSAIYAADHKYAVSEIDNRSQWDEYAHHKTDELKKILGMDRMIPLAASVQTRSDAPRIDELIAESISLPVEGTLQIPVTILRPAAGQKLKPLILCSGAGRGRLLAETGSDCAVELARRGHLVVVPDLRFFGDIDLDNLIGVGPTSLMTFVPAYSQDNWICNQDYSFQYHIRRAWRRDSIVWGRPLVGMMGTDIRKIVDYLGHRSELDLAMDDLEIIGRRADTQDTDGSVPLAALFAAVMDSRIRRVDVDLAGRSFEERTLPAIPFVLWHGDVMQWTACLADRKVTVRGLSKKAGDPTWLMKIFAIASQRENLSLLEDE